MFSNSVYSKLKLYKEENLTCHLTQAFSRNPGSGSPKSKVLKTQTSQEDFEFEKKNTNDSGGFEWSCHEAWSWTRRGATGGCWKSAEFIMSWWCGFWTNLPRHSFVVGKNSCVLFVVNDRVSSLCSRILFNWLACSWNELMEQSHTADTLPGSRRLPPS